MAGRDRAARRERITRHAALLAGWPPDALGPLLRAVEQGAMPVRPPGAGGPVDDPSRHAATVVQRQAAALAAPHVAEAVTALGQGLRIAQDALLDGMGHDGLPAFLEQVQGRPPRFVGISGPIGLVAPDQGSRAVADETDRETDRESDAVMASHVLICDFLAHQDAHRVHVLRRMAPSSSPFWLRALALIGLEIGAALLFRAVIRRLKGPVA